MILLLILLSIPARGSDASILHQLRQQPGMHRARVLHRAHVDPQLDAVLAIGSPRDRALSPTGDVWWDPHTIVGFYLQDREHPGRVFQIALAPGHDYGDCLIRIARVTSTDAILACIPEKGTTGENRKFVYDIRAKALVQRIDYPWRPLEPAPPATPLPPAPIPLPKSTYTAFALARPQRVRDGYAPGHTTLADTMGPRQQDGHLLWFGKSFYDGEGHSGIGAFGYLDLRSKSYTLFSPPEIRDFSVTAILVEPGAIWLAIATHGEWTTYGRGLLHYDRANETIQSWPLEEPVHAITRRDGAITLSTAFGRAILNESRLRRFFYDRTTSGRWRILETTAP